MIFQSLLQKQPAESLHENSRVLDMGALNEDTVIIRLGNKAGDPSIITVNCPDQLGLACDLARSIFEFGLDVVRADFSTDGRWCLMLFWVTPGLGPVWAIKWAVLKKRLISACPSPSLSLFTPPIPEADKKNNVYLLQTCSVDRAGLLNDMTQTLWELEVDVLKVNGLTSPDGSAVNVFYLSDSRNALQNKRRHEVACDRIKSVLGASYSFCELSVTSDNDLNEISDLGMFPTIPNDLFSKRWPSTEADVAFINPAPNTPKFSLNIDNSLSPGHTLLQITFQDRRGLLYDCTRALSDLNLQIAYGRLSTTPKGSGDLDLFILQANGNKLFDPDKQKTLLDRLRLDMCDPIRLMMVNRGPDTELLVATTVEKCGRVRPRILYDVTLALKMLEICIFKADTEKLSYGDRLWEVYRFLLVEQPKTTFRTSRTRSHIVERVEGVLMG